jgi:ABC-type uncharacterized transport system substrate-binding protein
VNRYQRSATVLSLLFLGLVRLGATVVVVVQTDSQDASEEALAGIKTVVPAAQSQVLGQGAPVVGPNDVVVALGDGAALAAYPSTCSLVVALLTDQDLKIERPCVRVSPLPDAFFLMSKIRDLVPTLQTLAVFNTQDHFDAYIKYLAAAGFVSNTTVLPRSVNSPADLVAGLRALPGHAQALWLTPESSFLNLSNFNLIKVYCTANKIALIAPVTLLARAGALAGVAPSAGDQGQAAGKAAAGLEAGTFKAINIVSDQCDVLINPSAAQALGLKADARDGTLVQ